MCIIIFIPLNIIIHLNIPFLSFISGHNLYLIEIKCKIVSTIAVLGLNNPLYDL